MPLMEWNPRLSVKVAKFDDEHKQLLGMLNELFDAVSAGKGKDVLGGILDRLVRYTQTHFAHEEQAMREHAYPDLARHQAEHKALTEQVLEVQAKLKAGATNALSMEVMNFLKNWLTTHIQGSDAKYGVHLNAKGVR